MRQSGSSCPYLRDQIGTQIGTEKLSNYAAVATRPYRPYLNLVCIREKMGRSVNLPSGESIGTDRDRGQAPATCEGCGRDLPALTDEELASLPDLAPALCEGCLHEERAELRRMARGGGR